MKTISLFFCTFLFLILGVSEALACSCMGPEAKAALPHADAVFLGKATEVRYLDPKEQTSPEPRTVVTFSIEKVWKGVKGDSFEVHTRYNIWTCHGFSFKKGKRYLVVSTKRPIKDTGWEEELAGKEYYNSTTLCSGTRAAESAKKQIAELGPSLTPK